MKKHLSVLMLFTRSTLYRFLLIILAMAVVETALFMLAFRNARGFFGLDTILSDSRLGLVCAAGFLSICALLCLTGCEFGGRQGCTLSRLRVSHRAVFIWQSVNNAGMLFLFWAFQVGIVLAFCAVYTSRYPQPQAVMLAFYQSDFLHSLFPLAEWSRFISNLFLLVALAVTTACFPVRMRRGQKPLAAFVLAVFCIQTFAAGVGSSSHAFAFSAVSLFVAFVAVSGIWKEDGDE